MIAGAGSIRAVTLCFVLELFGTSMPVNAQLAPSTPIPVNLKPTLALIECNDGTHRTYLTGAVVASNDVRSFVATAESETPPPMQRLECHAPLVYFGDNLTRGYPAQAIPVNYTATGNGTLTIYPCYLLAVDHPVAQVTALSARAPLPSAAFELGGFSAPLGTTSKATVTFVAVPGAYQPSSSIGGYSMFGSPATIQSGIMFDPQSGEVLGLAGFVAASTYIATTPDVIRTLLQHLPGPVVPGLNAAAPARSAAERLASQFAYPLFDYPAGSAKGEYFGLALVVGSTSSSTILVLSSLRPTERFAPYIDVRDRSGIPKMVKASVIAKDPDNGLQFLAISKLDVPPPQFAAIPSSGLEASEPFVYGALCEWDAPAPAPDSCPLDVAPVQITLPPEFANAPQWLIDAGKPPTLGLTGNTMWTLGSPLFDPAAGAIVGFDNGERVLPVSVLKADTERLHLGITLKTLR